MSKNMRKEFETVLMGACRDSILSPTIKARANLGLVLVKMRKTGSRLETLMAGGQC